MPCSTGKILFLELCGLYDTAKAQDGPINGKQWVDYDKKLKRYNEHLAACTACSASEAQREAHYAGWES